MAFPSSAIFELTSGVPGEVGIRTPYNGMTAKLDSTDESNNVFGRAFTYKSNSIESVQAGGNGQFAGLLVYPKAHSVNDVSSTLDTIPNSRTGEFCIDGEIYVRLTVGGASSIGAGIFFENATGRIGAGIAGAGQTQIAGATVVRHNTSSSDPSLALVRLKREFSVFFSIMSVLSKYGSDAHLWIPGIGSIDGIMAKNWIDAAGTNPAVLSSTIGRVDDNGGGSIPAAQAVGAYQPILGVDTNGKFYWQFDGSNDYLSLSAPLFQMTDDLCVVAGVSLTSLKSGQSIFAQSNLSNHALPQLTIDNAGRLVGYAFGGGALVNATGGPNNLNAGPIVAAMAIRSLGMSVRRNGMQVASATLSGTYASASTASIGAFPSVSVGEQFGGNFYPVVAIKGTVLDDDLIAIESWIANMSGIPV